MTMLPDPEQLGSTRIYLTSGHFSAFRLAASTSMVSAQVASVLRTTVHKFLYLNSLESDAYNFLQTYKTM